MFGEMADESCVLYVGVVFSSLTLPECSLIGGTCKEVFSHLVSTFSEDPWNFFDAPLQRSNVL